MQCKDIPDEPILAFIRERHPRWCTWRGDSDVNVAAAMPAGVPSKLVLAKMKSLIHRGLIDGCGCGCRGDFCLKPDPMTRTPERV